MEKPSGTKEKIVETARSLFAEKGYKGTPTAEIAREAGFSEGTIYRHFNSKKDLLMECVVPVMQKIVDTTESYLDHYPAKEKDLKSLFIKMLEMRLHLFQENYQTFRIIFGELLFSKEMLNLYMEFILNQNEKLAGIISQVENLDEIKRTRNYMLFGMGQVLSIWMYLNFMKWSKEDGMEFSHEMLNISEETFLPDMADYLLYGIAGVSEEEAIKFTHGEG